MRMANGNGVRGTGVGNGSQNDFRGTASRMKSKIQREDRRVKLHGLLRAIVLGFKSTSEWDRLEKHWSWC